MIPRTCKHCSFCESDEDGSVCTAEKNEDGERFCEVRPELDHTDRPSERYSK